MAIVFDDAYLRKHCTDIRRDRAYEYVDMLGSDYTDDWRDELARLRCYVLVCQENQAAEDDLFSMKLDIYNKEFSTQLTNANLAVAEAAGEALPAVFSIPLERG